MRRIATIFSLIVLGAAAFAVAAGADDKKTYQAELFNGFGLVEGSELRIAGVKAGTVTGLDITPEKTALITFEVEPEFPELTDEATCSSEPQSLIAEYFLDCQPGSGDGPLEGPIPADRNQTTVQNDLVQNTLREPFKRRFQLILNEFGTALVGNSENLNAAIRAGAPALRELSKVLKILGRQNRIIAQLNTDSDTVFAKLTDRREDVVRFIDEAEDAGRISAERREDLATDFDLLDDFLVELRPVMHELGNLAREQTPLLTDLQAAAPGLNKLAKNLPGFNRASEVSLESLGNASEVGERAVTKSRDEISELNTASQKAQPAGDLVADFLESLDDPRRAVEEDCDARFDLREQPGEADRRVALLEQRIGSQLTGTINAQPECSVPDINGGAPLPGGGNPGYTGLEGLLNYAYVQTVSLNLFDQIGHALAIQIVGEGTAGEPTANAPEWAECGEYSGGPRWPARDAAGLNPAVTNDIRQAAHCVGALGDYQPGITPGTNTGTSNAAGEEGVSGLTRFDPGNPATTLPPYDPEVCSAPVSKGTTVQNICDPNAPDFDSAFSAPAQADAAPEPQAADEPKDEDLDDVLDKIKDGTLEDLDEIREALGLPPGAPLPDEVLDALGQDSDGADSTGTGDAGTGTAAPTVGSGSTAPAPSPESAAAVDLMDYLFGP